MEQRAPEREMCFQGYALPRKSKLVHSFQKQFRASTPRKCSVELTRVLPFCAVVSLNLLPQYRANYVIPRKIPQWVA